MLVHICCSVDSFYFLSELKKKEANKKIVGYFYDPNIHPFEEYAVRCLEARRSCEILGLDFIEGDYNSNKWFVAAKGLEKEKEGNMRCNMCFEHRLLNTAQKAKELGISCFTTTLLMSPKKSLQKLEICAKNAQDLTGINFCFYDFRSNGGTNKQFRMAKEQKTYFQNYCGCLYALLDQRRTQNKNPLELFSSIYKKNLRGSLAHRLDLYQKRKQLEQDGKTYIIEKRQTLLYRLLWAKLTFEKKVLPSYVLCFSYSKHKIVRAQNLHLFALKDYNLTFKDLQEMSEDDELILRLKLGFGLPDLSVIVFVENVVVGAKLELNAQIYEDFCDFLFTKNT